MGGLGSAAPPGVRLAAPGAALEHVWADAFPELSVPVAPAVAVRPRLLALDDDVAHELGWDRAFLESDAGLRLLTGGSRASGSAPVAQVYAGHQWGVYKPLLGDGRAALLGERRDRSGRLRDLHLKGIGPTPMSRVDGYAAVGPMLREFLMGVAMHALGVPTTRMLAVVATGAPRAIEGRVQDGAVLARTAAGHVRIGSFEYAAATGDVGLLRRLAGHVAERHYPDTAGARHPSRALLREIVDASAALTAAWMGVGFVHGVLSTDNVLVSAETIDFGPCAFLDAYEPGAWFSSIDATGRYAYDAQPAIMQWNLGRLGDALAPLLADGPEDGRRVAAEEVAAFPVRYRAHRASTMREKLGLDHRIAPAAAVELADAALRLLDAHGVDFTGFWRDLAAAADGDERPVRGRFLGQVPALDDWLRRWSELGPDAARIRAANPVYIPRNHLVEEALDAAVAGDLAPFETLVDVLRSPFAERSGADHARYARPAPAGAPPHRTFCGT